MDLSLDQQSVSKPGALSSRGTNQSSMRAYNERLVLSLIRRHKALAKAELTRITGLSAQTISVIMRALEADELIIRGDVTRIKGRVGQPSTPMSLNPDGALFFGFKIGRRRFDLVLINFLGEIIEARHEVYQTPTPESALAFAQRSITSMVERLPEHLKNKIAGLGICQPFKMWDWPDRFSPNPGLMQAWRETNLRDQMAQIFDLPVYLQNDSTAACGAELVLGDNHELQHFLYLYIGYFIGGGLVINGNLFTGSSGNAAAIGSILVNTKEGRLGQLIDVASLAVIQERTNNANSNSLDINQPMVQEWVQQSGYAIAQAVASSTAVIACDTVVIDGRLPTDVRSALTESTEKHLLELDCFGIDKPRVVLGQLGEKARELGAACIPLTERFMVNPRDFLK